MALSLRKRWLSRGVALAGFVVLHAACSKLDSPNDFFPLVASGGATSSGGGSSATGASTSSGGRGGASDGPGGTQSNIGGGDAGQDCTDATGLNGQPCYKCQPYDITTLESACSSATCTPFNNRLRLTLLSANGQLPDLPAASATGGSSATNSTAASGGTSGATGGSASVLATTPSGGTSGVIQAGGATAAGGATNASGGAASNTTSLPPCDSLSSQGTVIYVTGSSAAKPFLQQIAQQLATLNVYIVYTSTGSCVGVDAILNDTPMTTGSSPAPTTSATYWANSSDPGTACAVPVAGVTADLGMSDVFVQTCPGFEMSSLESSQVRDAHGPIQTMTFAVPANASQTAISAQAAYFVYGFGSTGGVLDSSGSSPIWNDETYLLHRSPTSGTQAMIAEAIGVPTGAWKGKAYGSSDDLAAALQAAGASQATAEKTVGILAADYIDSKNLRAQIRVLAYQDTNQPCSVYPDATASARDKRNVRDGHYPIWGPLHILYKVDATGNPLNPDHRQSILDIVGYMAGTKALPNGIKLIDLFAQSGLIPECAMHVTRQHDGGSILPYTPPSPCSCLFEFKATGTTSCNPCTVQGDCASSDTCSLGYCEKN